MKNQSKTTKALLALFKKKKIATIHELKEAAFTNSRMTLFRKLKKLGYFTSYSHSGRFYSLKRFVQFNELGLWFFKSVKFSQHGTLLKTVERMINESNDGFTARELETLLKVKVGDTLLELIKDKIVVREKIGGTFVYFSTKYHLKKQQELLRKDSIHHLDDIKMKPEVLMNEVKAALILFFSILNEKQRRLYAGFESLKVGHGGDKQIAELLELNEKTVARGRKELLADKVEVDSIRRKGGGRIGIKKKFRSHHSNPGDHEA